LTEQILDCSGIAWTYDTFQDLCLPVCMQSSGANSSKENLVPSIAKDLDN